MAASSTVAAEASPPATVPDNPKAIQAYLAEAGVEFVRFEQPDLHGIARSKTVPLRHFGRFARDGLNFPLPPLALDVRCVPGRDTGYLEERGYTDSRLRPDFATVRILPWLENTARVICDPHHVADGTPALGGSRWAAVQLLAELDSLGFRLLSGFELEFFLVDAATGKPSYPDVRQFANLDERDRPVIYAMLRHLQAAGIDVITADQEYGAGQVEINFAAAWGRAAADDAFTFRNAVKEIARRHGRTASFMTKPDIAESANGCHYNHSLWRGEENAFADPDGPRGLSRTALHFLAGQIEHAAALTAFSAPTVNCAKRYRQNAFAPTNRSWGIENRTVAFRVKPYGHNRAHIENRLGSGAVNPYLLQAAVLAAGLDGLRRKLLPPPPVVSGPADGLSGQGSLPLRLEDSLDALEADAVLREALGAELVRLFLGLKRFEVEKARQAIADYDSPAFLERVDSWERAEFFELL
ncbi:MAG: glutamine synthetase family protein [Dongiaceae bacterium]